MTEDGEAADRESLRERVRELRARLADSVVAPAEQDAHSKPARDRSDDEQEA